MFFEALIAVVDANQANSTAWRRSVQISEESTDDLGDRVHVGLIKRSMV